MLFDEYLAVDWSAASKPKRGRDSVWLCLHGSEPENPSTRVEATEWIRTQLRTHVAGGRRVLVGFDFPYGYPRGFAEAALSGDGPPWRRVWDELSGLIRDAGDNANNRFDVAAALNERLGGEGPFWGCPVGAQRPALTSKRRSLVGLPELRETEQRLRGVQSAWKLGGAGAVGSQALLGIPHVASLRDDPELAPVSRVWPFESGFALPPDDVRVVHVEIWPGVVKTDLSLHPVKDAAQVATLVRAWAAADRVGDLFPLFDAPPRLDGDTLEVTAWEEGWIFGARAAPARRRRRSGIVFGAIAPHGDLVLGEEPAAPVTRAALEELGRRHAAAKPNATVVVTPHNVHVDRHFAVVTSARVGDIAVDRELAGVILTALAAEEIPALGVSYGGNDAEEAELPIDWGTEIQLEFLRAERIVVVSPARDRPLDEHVRAGRAIAVASEARRVALIASADHGHAHDAAGPYGFDPAAAEYDERIRRIVRENRLIELLGLGPLAAAARADSLWQMLVLYGAVENGWRAELLSYEAPTYYGMLCAAFEPR